ncbi:MAG: hypothetical protein ACI4FX_09865 [Agathobacter sp.]
MSGLLLGLRRQIAKNRRKEAYVTRYVPKAAPVPAVASGKMKLEPENLDELEPETESVKPVAIVSSQPQEKVQSTEEKVEESGKMEEKDAEERTYSFTWAQETPMAEETKKIEEEVPERKENTDESPKQEEPEKEADEAPKEEAEPEKETEEAPKEEAEPEKEADEVPKEEAEPEKEADEAPKEEAEPEKEAEEAPKEEAEPEKEAGEAPEEKAEPAPEKEMDEAEEPLHGPRPFDFSAYQNTPKADMISNGVKPFDFEQYRKNIQNSEEKTQEQPVEEDTIEEAEREPEVAPVELIRDNTPRQESKEDFLLKEIDEFRERAKRLQMLLDNRETEAEKLQSIVDERQEKADELDQILQERQKEADGITAQVERQIDALIDKVSVKMDELEASMADQNEDGRRFSEQKAKELKETLGQIQEQLTTLKTELSDKVHTENVKCFRNISDLLKGTEQKIDSMSEIEDQMDEKIAPVKLLGISSLVVGIINFVAIVILMIVSMISSGAIG